MNIKVKFDTDIISSFDDMILSYGLCQKSISVIDTTINIPENKGIVYIYGISGSGKSLILKKISEIFNVKIFKFDTKLYNDIDIVLKDYVKDLKLLSMFGFSDVPVLVTPVKYLSDGQKYRLFLLEKIRDNDIVLIDEFCNPLDDIYTLSILKSLTKFKDNKLIIVATIKDRVYEYFDLDYVYYVRHGNAYRKKYYVKNILDDVKIVKATIKDWEYFSRFHYRSKSCGIFNMGLKAILNNEEVGIIVCGSPYLNISLRNKIFSKYKNNGKLVNKEIFMIHRIVVTPEVRNLGIAGKLINESIKRYPDKKLCELITSLSDIIPFTKKYGFKCGGKVPDNPVRIVLQKLNFDFTRFLDNVYVSNFIKDNENEIRKAVLSSYKRGMSINKEYTFDELVYNVQRMCNVVTYYFYKELDNKLPDLDSFL